MAAWVIGKARTFNRHFPPALFGAFDADKIAFVDDRDTATMDDDIPVKENLFVVFRERSYRITKENLHIVAIYYAIHHCIPAKKGINHWIPFTEDEVGCTKTAFKSSFMSDFIKGKIKKTNGDLFHKPKVENGTKCRFSPEAQAVFDAGKEIWRYYHAQEDINVSFYDIREYFQGRNEKTNRMNNSSTDQKYNELLIRPTNMFMRHI